MGRRGAVRSGREIACRAMLLGMVVASGCSRGDVARGGSRAARPTSIVLPLSTSREPVPPSDEESCGAGCDTVEVSADAIRCGGRIVAVIHTENGRRVLEETARTGGTRSSFLPDLRACLVAETLDRRALPWPNGSSAWRRLLLVADRATPMRILEDVLYTAAEAGREPLQLVVRTWAADLRAHLGVPARGVVTLNAGGWTFRCGCKKDPVLLGLVATVTDAAVILQAAPGLTERFLPAAAPDGVGGRVSIPHQTVSRGIVQRALARCRPPADPAEFNDCSYWGYLGSLLSECYGAPSEPVMMPDLKELSRTLREIRRRVASESADLFLLDEHRLAFRLPEDMPYCEAVALMDFARFVVPDYDWSHDAVFLAELAEGKMEDFGEVLSESYPWGDTMRAQLLFPVVGFVR